MLTGLMLSGRVGSGIAAELGSMVVTDQINALRSLGTDPVRKLVVPRMLAGIFMAPALTVVADFVGIVGGWMVARFRLAGRVWPVLVVHPPGLVHARRVDGSHQALRAGLRDRHDCVSRRPADEAEVREESVKRRPRPWSPDRSPSSQWTTL